MKRVQASAWALLIALDVLACTLWLAPLHALGLADKPTGRQMISGYVGKAAYNGHRWAFLPERLIDGLFGRGHCLKAYLRGLG